jgi:hypothetical protein
VAGCREPKWDKPEDAYTSFAQAVRIGRAKLSAGDEKAGRAELKTAYEALSGPTRTAIEERSKEISSTSGGAVKDDPVLLAFVTGVKPEPLEAVRTLHEEGAAATVSVTVGGKTVEQKMVKEGERWKVDLSEAFKK